MILVTGAAGFIGSVQVWKLNRLGYDKIVVCDQFRDGEKWRNLRDLRFEDAVLPEDLFEWLGRHGREVEAVIHLGACSATTETNMDFLWENNVVFTRRLWDHSVANGNTFLYASSAATYGGGECGYLDDEKKIHSLKPLNKYGYSKHWFDLWALRQKRKPKHWYGLKFFNVFGPNEYHKGHMASVVYHNYQQYLKEGKVRLFKSHREGIADGEQKRDFVYVKDVVRMNHFLQQGKAPSGIYNIASGKARSYKDFALALFAALKVEPKIEFVETPAAIREKYQYFTEGDLSKLRAAGYIESSTSLEEAV
ncbi:MAG: ADP-glyceromanno-heptose 6-epimerase, partial [Spirochaetia bacterium]|nr:ADP-glyceromanno-heptose 6-epimerase [Spirochaetia bacterium]